MMRDPAGKEITVHCRVKDQTGAEYEVIELHPPHHMKGVTVDGSTVYEYELNRDSVHVVKLEYPEAVDKLRDVIDDAEEWGPVYDLTGVQIKLHDTVKTISGRFLTVYDHNGDFLLCQGENEMDLLQIHPKMLEVVDEIPSITSPSRYQMKASDYLTAAGNHMKDRESTYDSPGGERSMGKTVQMFNTLYDLELTEEMGWRFMSILKQVRSSQGAYKSDNYEDGCAYEALAGEAAAKHRDER